MTVLKGKAWVFGPDVNTDIIIPFRFKARTNDPNEMAKYCMYGIDPEFHKKVRPGDFIVAGKNFGGGSSREQAPVAIKYAGIAAVISEGFARIFYRNSFAIGLPVLEIPGVTKHVQQEDELEVDLDKLTVKLVKNGNTVEAKKTEGFLEELMRVGGLANYYKKYGKFPWQNLT